MPDIVSLRQHRLKPQRGPRRWRHFRRVLRNVSGDAPIARLNELDCPLAVPKVHIERSRHRRAGEVLKRREEPDRGGILVDQVLQVKEVHVAREVAEQPEELRVSGKHVAERARLLKIVPADALHCQIEAVSDPRVAGTRHVDRHLPTDLIGRKDHLPGNRPGEMVERFALDFRDLINEGRPPPEGLRDRIARQHERAELGAVVQVIRRRTVCLELEQLAARQPLAPQQLVIPPERRTPSVRIFAGRRIDLKSKAMSIISMDASASP